MQFESEQLVAQIICDSLVWMGGIYPLAELGGSLLHRCPGKEHTLFYQLVGGILDGKSVANLAGNFITGIGFLCRFGLI